ncbi:MAG: sensor histidine kinase [Thermomicrobiales bacterium]
MDRLALHLRPAQLETYRFLNWALRWLRWITLAVLLLITLVRPAPNRGSLPNWSLILFFIAYNLLIGLLQHWSPNLRSFAWVALLDLLVASALYLLSTEPGGPIFVLFFLAVDSAAASLTLRDTLLYTAALATIAATIETMLPLWSSTSRDIRQLISRLVMLGLVGAGMAIVSRRLALEHAAAQRNQAEAGRMEELDRLRLEFISTVSHDLLTPLTASQAGLGMLEASIAERLQPAERDLLSNIRVNTEYLGVMIDDLLALNQIEAGMLRIEHTPIDLCVIARTAAATVHTLVTEKRQMVDLDLPDTLPCLGDARRLQQVLVNLLANAHRYAPEDARIMLHGAATGAEVHLSVHDTGPGIPAGEHEAIFQRFYRVASPMVSAVGGSGLGLAIARGIVELHDGRMWAESEAGQGATFHVVLPCPVRGEEA